MLSDEFLAEIRQTDKKNLAIEALKKLINGDVRAHGDGAYVRRRGSGLLSASGRYGLQRERITRPARMIDDFAVTRLVLLSQKAADCVGVE